LHRDDDAQFTQWEVHEVKGDGRCLFRSISVARALSRNGLRESEVNELASADELRTAAVNELLERREETEWFIEGDFDNYIARMRQPMAWGGEPEIVMLTHVLASPISVYMAEGGGMRSIGVYGEEYAESAQYDDLAVLFHGAGHYEALRVFGRA
jgi:OTU domain-containing protein 6